MIRKFRQILQSTSGNVAMLTGLLAFPLFTAAGIAMDYTKFVNLRGDIQQSLDAAGLATGVEFNSTQDEAVLRAYATDFFESNLGPNIKPEEYEFEFQLLGDDDKEEGDGEVADNDDDDEEKNEEVQLEIKATIKYKTFFGKLVGVDTLSEELISIISLDNRTVEVALVLDNSGSMVYQAGTNNTSVAPVSSRRITLLKSAATDLVNQIFDAVEDSDLENPAQFSVVPFSGTVNVGNIDHVNHDDGNDFLDTNGFASYHNENLDWLNSYRHKTGETVEPSFGRAAVLRKNDGSEQFLTRLDVFPMVGTEWEGCVEMRPWPHNVQDTYHPNTAGFSSGNSDALFVPYLVPDAPDDSYYDFFRNSNSSLVTVFEGNTRRYTPSYLTDFIDYNADTNEGFAVYQRDDQFGPGDSGGQIFDNKINRTNWLWKYQSVQALSESEKPSFEKNLNSFGSSYFADSGPNAFCPDSEILQLTENRQQIIDHLNTMEAHGSTNIQQGLTWGWRTLSRARPFIGGRPLSERNNLKILILLTDGNNQQLTQSNPNNTQYSAWGYQRDPDVLPHPISGQNTHGRLLEGTTGSDRAGTIFESQFALDPTPDTREEFEDIMNLHTNQACNNVKDDGISIYAIAFDVPNQGKVRSLLENCAGSGRINGNDIISNVVFYHDVQGIQLEDTFKEIARGISSLRVSQ